MAGDKKDNSKKSGDGKKDKPKLKTECRFFCNSKGTSVYLFLEIKNVYNNVPIFINSPYEYNISELTRIGTTINPDPDQIVMYDRDYPELDPVMTVETEVNEPGMFEFLPHSPEAYGKYLHLYIILNGILDFSKETTYYINLTVKDRGNPPNMNKTTVTINVIDEDNQDPIFEKFLYYTEIIANKTKNQIYLSSNGTRKIILYEDLKNGGTLPLKIDPQEICAYDQDFGINATINYALGESAYVEYFDVNKEEGSIFLKKFEERMISNHSFIVPLEAYQIDDDKRRAMAALVVTVTVINPVQPHFTLPIYISKNLLAGDNFYQVEALQDDIVYQIHDAENQYISINETSGSLSLKQNASQLISNFNFDIVAKTQVASINNKFQGHFAVIERDPLKTPLFNKSVYFVEISKTSNESDHLFKIPVNDPKAELRLVGDDSKYFDIEKSVNWIILMEKLLPDKTTYFVTIEALNKNSVTMERDNAEVIFQVTDPNCRPKIFEEGTYLVNMIPDWGINDIVFTIKSNLPDVMFHLSGEYEDHFSINSEGHIYLIKPMNICQGSELSVSGELKVPPFVSGSTKIVLQVSDQFCTTRLFQTDAYFVDMSPDWKEGSSIIKLTSLLPDVTFSLEDSTTGFTIDPTSGEIVMSAPVNICKSQSLTVSGKPEKFFYQEGRAQIVLQVSDQFCTTRLFQTDAYFVDMSPDWKEGSSIIKLTALLPNVTFSLEDSTTGFTIDPTSGEIVMSAPVNICESQSLTVSGKPEKFFYQEGRAQVIFQVKDQRCYAKLFEYDSYVIDISSDWEESDNILNITFSMPVNKFHLLGEDAAFFNIASSGKLYLADKLDICKNYEFVVFGQAHEPVLHNGTTQIILLSKEAKCHKPIFEKDTFLIDISQEWKVGENIFNLSSEFPDVAFSLKDNNEYFEIDNATGQLFLMMQLDKCKKYEVAIHGNTTGPPPREGVAKLIFMSEVCIKGTREFSKCVYTVNVERNERKGKSLLKFRKENEPSNVKFVISEGNDKGLFDIKDGELILNKKPTIDDQYILKVGQIIEEKVSRSVKRNDHFDVSNSEALVIVNIGERKSQIRFLHPENWFKLFLPTAPLSDYWFTVKTVVGDEINSLKFSIGPEDNTDFEVDSSSGLVSPKIDVTVVDGYKADLVISAATANSGSAELSIHIRRLRYKNTIRITLKSSSNNVISLKNMERNMSASLDCDVHILQYKRRTDSLGYDLVAGAVKDSHLLTFQELEERMKNKAKDLKDIIGDFSLAPYTEKLTKDIAEKSKADPLLISTVVLACLSIILCVLLLVFVIMRKFRSETADSATSEGKEPCSGRDVIQLSNHNHVEVTISSEDVQLQPITVIPLEKTEPENADKTENTYSDTSSNEPGVLEHYENNNPNVKEEEADIKCSMRMNIQPELYRHVEETINEDNNLLGDKEAASHSYCNEAFEDNPLNPMEENKKVSISPSEKSMDEQNELETNSDCNANVEVGEKKTLVKFDDVATLIP